MNSNKTARERKTKREEDVTSTKKNKSTPREIINDAENKNKKRGIKRSISHILPNNQQQLRVTHSPCTITSTSNHIIYFDSITLVQYNLIVGQYIQIALDLNKELLKSKVWAKIGLNAQLDKHSVVISHKLACDLQTIMTTTFLKANNDGDDFVPKEEKVTKGTPLLIYLSSVKSMSSVTCVNTVSVKRRNIENDNEIYNGDIPLMQFVCDSFLQWAHAEQICFLRNEKIEFEFCGRLFPLIISTSEVKSKELFCVSPSSTHVTMIENDGQNGENMNHSQICWWKNNVSFDNIAQHIPGYRKQVNLFCEYIFGTSGSHGFRGVLLRGESGVGKSFFVQTILGELRKLNPLLFTYQSVTNELLRGNVGESEKYLRSMFVNALTEKHGIHVIVLENLLDMESGARVEKLIISELIYCMDMVARQNDVRIVLVAIMSNMNSVDSSLLRVGRLECEIELKVPAPEARLEIFNALTHNRFIDDVEFQEQLSHDTHGYVAADLCKLCAEATVLSSQPEKEHYLQAIGDLKHSLLLSATIGDNNAKSKSNVRFADLAGIDDIVQRINISILYPLTNREKYEALGINPPRGVLLKGPPGTGKTTLARAIATEAKANFVSVQCTDIISKVVGAPSRAISQLFNRARASSPCVLFFDQFEAIARARGNDSSESQSADQMLSTLLIEMDGVNTNKSTQVLVLAATNKPEMLDTAILRPGRFDQQIELRIPNQSERLQIVNAKLKNTPVHFEHESEKMAFEAMVSYELNGLTAADLDNWCRESVMLCLRENINNQHVLLRHFIKAKNILLQQRE